MHEKELWAGAELKAQHASLHFTEMARLVAREARGWEAPLEASGVTIGGNWQPSFYAHLDALLSAVHSIPEIIQCCFGYDRSRQMKDWFAALTAAEQARRSEFSEKFEPSHMAFRKLPLGEARHQIEHRTGVAPVEVTVIGRFGVTYRGGPATLVPMSETPVINDPNFPPSLARAHPLRPMWNDFTIQGQPLFETCQDYLNRAAQLISEARLVAARVHGDEDLSPPSI